MRPSQIISHRAEPRIYLLAQSQVDVTRGCRDVQPQGHRRGTVGVVYITPDITPARGALQAVGVDVTRAGVGSDVNADVPREHEVDLSGTRFDIPREVRLPLPQQAHVDVASAAVHVKINRRSVLAVHVQFDMPETQLLSLIHI